MRISARGGKRAYPFTAWFGVGAIPAFVLAAIVSGAMYGVSETSSEKTTAWFIGVIAWIAGGWITTWLLVRQAERRDGMAMSSQPSPSAQPPATRVPPADRPRYEALLKKRDVAGLSDAEAGELGRIMAQAQE